MSSGTPGSQARTPLTCYKTWPEQVRVQPCSPDAANYNGRHGSVCVPSYFLLSDLLIDVNCMSRITLQTLARHARIRTHLLFHSNIMSSLYILLSMRLSSLLKSKMSLLPWDGRDTSLTSYIYARTVYFPSSKHLSRVRVFHPKLWIGWTSTRSCWLWLDDIQLSGTSKELTRILCFPNASISYNGFTRHHHLIKSFPRLDSYTDQPETSNSYVHIHHLPIVK